MIRTSATVAIVFCLALPLRAQDVEAPPPDSPATDLPPPVSVTYVDGEVQYLNAGAAERADAQTMLNDGDGIRTARGRAELVFGDGSVLHLDEHTAVDLLSDHRLRLLGGRIVFRASAASGHGYVIDTPAASVRVDQRGEYNLLVDGRNQAIEVAVARGVAEIEQSSERTVVRAGEEARLDRPGDRPLIRAFNSARLDAFERWSLTRYEGEELSPSSRRLPTELRAYGQTFDRYGRWDYVAPYGPVWYPSVTVGWRPYYNGSWRHTRYGWTWYGVDPWAWPTHHYGRWQFAGNVWFWIPARVWGPAWVSWAYAPGYVSWAPLGWNSRPVVPFYLHPGYGHPDRWRAWTVLPRGYLGRPGPIRPWVVDAYRQPRVATAAFVQQPIPAYRSPSYAIRRDGRRDGPSGVRTGPIDRAVPRSGPNADRNTIVGSASGAPVSQPGATGAVRRDPRSGRERAPSGTFEQQWGGMAVPRSTTPSAQPEPKRQQEEPRSAIRRPDSPAYAPSTPSAPESRPRWEGPGPNDVNREGTRSGSARGGDVRSPRAERPERPAPSGGYSSPRSEGGRSEGTRPEGTRSSPRAEGAKPRGESGSGASEGRARGGESRGGGGESRGGGSGRSGGVRRPPSH